MPDADAALELRDPRTGAVVGSMACTPVAEVAGRVAAARHAQNAWAALPLDARKEAIEKLASTFLSRAADVARTLQEEIGKPSGEAWTSEVVTAQELFAHWLGVIDDELEPVEVPLNPVNYPFKVAELRPEPLGVIALIMPWNYPVHLPLRTIVPALLAGNTVVFKPSELAPRCGSLLAEIFAAALPADVVVTVIGGPAQGAAVVDTGGTSGGIAKVVFTGSVPGGRKVAAHAAARLVPSACELGSKDAAIVLHDAKLDRAVAGIAWGAFHNAGQDCASVERCFVDRRVHDTFVEGVVAAAKALRLGDDLGPLVDARAVAKVDAQVKDAVKRGARLLCGGEPAGQGYFYPATVLVDVPSDCALMREETFGPVLPITAFDVEDGAPTSAVALANDSVYGLCVSVWSRDIARAEKLAAKVECGVSYVNNCCFTGPMGGAAWGGVKESGFGVTGSRWGLAGLVHPRTVVLDRSFQGKEMWWYPYTPALTTMARGLVELGRSGGAKLAGVRMALAGLTGRWKAV
jgi:acyl-CoA reductase-like NAD-dependent aldehyde dehydrogenase